MKVFGESFTNLYAYKRKKFTFVILHKVNPEESFNTARWIRKVTTDFS